ncbi:alpha/beta fold hydrolase [Candidatus Nanohaloarchaea archaeon]|nr:alpha/beta fold hydrolase [Candidatus Nanohaloarchaea archaeon]
MEKSRNKKSGLDKLDVTTEKHQIEVENGEEISAVHHKSDSDKWIFFCHGFGSNKEGSYEARAERAVEEGFNAARFDFRGNGESDGCFKEQFLSDKIDDLKACVEYFDPDRVLLFGMSFGGKVVFHAARDVDAEVVVGKSPVTYNSVMDKFREAVEENGEFTLFEDKTITADFYTDLDTYDFREAVEGLDVPVAIFHGGADTTVHFENSAKAVKELDGEALLYKLKGEKHSLSDDGEAKMQDMMFSWLENL